MEQVEYWRDVNSTEPSKLNGLWKKKRRICQTGWISIGGTLAKICEFYGELIGTGTCWYLCGLISGKPSNLCQRFDANPTRHISYHLAIEHSHGKSQCLDHIRGGIWCLI
jgi:hypothetical protein